MQDGGGDEKVRFMVANVRQGEESQRRERDLKAMAGIGNREGQGGKGPKRLLSFQHIRLMGYIRKQAMPKVRECGSAK